MPKLRFITEAERSPSMETADAGTASSASSSQFGCKSLNQSRYAPKARKTATQPRTPPIAPSTVFLGLISGHSLCLPSRLPAKYAKVSVDHAAIKTSR